MRVKAVTTTRAAAVCKLFIVNSCKLLHVCHEKDGTILLVYHWVDPLILYCIIIVVEQIDYTYSGETNYTQHTTPPPQLLIAKIGKVI
jgi:hypothetical protein